MAGFISQNGMMLQRICGYGRQPSISLLDTPFPIVFGYSYVHVVFYMADGHVHSTILIEKVCSSGLPLSSKSLDHSNIETHNDPGIPHFRTPPVIFCLFTISNKRFPAFLRPDVRIAALHAWRVVLPSGTIFSVMPSTSTWPQMG